MYVGFWIALPDVSMKMNILIANIFSLLIFPTLIVISDQAALQQNW